ncbi:hypothetical protein [Nocardia niwae]|uniref:hypothetical protein n=1 Tax=Nocardia niwae TaxID=626084 RepID=UPI003403B991
MTHTSEPQPFAAAGRALIALAVWSATRSDISVEQLVHATYDPGLLGDFGADLLHLLHLHGVDVDEFWERAWTHFHAESAAQPTSGPAAISGPARAARRMLERRSCADNCGALEMPLRELTSIIRAGHADPEAIREVRG